MPRASVSFEFSQRFSCSARKLFEWATDYEPDDLQLMAHQGRREVRRICNDTVLLVDTVVTASGKRVTKKKLVRIYEDRLAWTNTHLSGPALYSQFLYEAVPEGRGRSRLEFTGLQIVDVPSAGKRELAAMAARIRGEDVASWRRLARAMKDSS
jgi:hypothetical protein